ncbi:uncharacterized protein LOC144036995 isoform X1 [Vanacampus margaritifer]
MYSFMGGGLFCAIVGNILLVVSTATDYWMQYRVSGNYAHQGLWRYCLANKCHAQTDSIAYWTATKAFMILSGATCLAGVVAGASSFARFSSFGRFNRSFAAGIIFFVSTLLALLAMGVYTAATLNFLGRRFGDWRFSWSYILAWVATLMTFFAARAKSSSSWSSRPRRSQVVLVRAKSYSSKSSRLRHSQVVLVTAKSSQSQPEPSRPRHSQVVSITTRAKLSSSQPSRPGQSQVVFVKIKSSSPQSSRPRHSQVVSITTRAKPSWSQTSRSHSTASQVLSRQIRSCHVTLVPVMATSPVTSHQVMVVCSPFSLCFIKVPRIRLDSCFISLFSCIWVRHPAITHVPF